MRRFFTIAAVCAAILSAAASAHADIVCGLDPLKNEYLSVRIEPAESAIEVSRLSPGTFVAPQGSPQDGWIKINIPGRPPDGWVPARNVCPGQSR